MNKIKHFSIFLAVFWLFSNIISAQSEPTLMGDIDLEKTPHSWLRVLSGRSLTRPVRTSYGWADLTDGKMITAFSENGAILWQKSVPSNPENFISANDQDFLAVPLKNKKLCLLNPSGLVLWTKEIGFESKAAPFFGRDGRIFVFGKESISCFGINGIRKWLAKTESQNMAIAPAELDDGSVVVFLDALDSGRTVGIRFSPFGESLERIVFAGRVLDACSTPYGLLLAFTDGTLGLCSAGSDSAESKWTINGLSLSQGLQFVNLDTPSVLAIASPSPSGTKVSIVNTKEGVLLRSFNVGEVRSLTYATNSPNGIFMADNVNAAIYTQSAKRVRALTLPKKKNAFDYTLFGNNGTAILTSRSWNITGWKVLQAETQKKSSAKNAPNYAAFYKNEGIDFSTMHEAAKNSRKAALEKGAYASLEKQFWREELFIIDEYFSIKMKKNSIGGAKANQDKEMSNFSAQEQNAAISMLGLFGTKQASEYLAKILGVEKDDAVLCTALKAVQQIGYDNKNQILDAIEALIKNSSPKQEVLLSECCEALYSVCRFMGRSAAKGKGLAILSNLQMPQYSAATKENSRKIYEKLAELKL